MSRDPLEGVRPSDRFDPAETRPHDALDQPVAPPPARTAAPGRSPKVVVVMLIGVLCAVAAGAMAFYLTERGSPPRPKAAPTVRSTTQPSATPASDVVQQGAPSDTQ